MNKSAKLHTEPSASVSEEATRSPAPRSKRRIKPKKDSLRPSKAPYNFPKNSLEDCVRLAQLIEEKNAGKPTPAKELPTLVGFHQANDWRFLDLLRSSELFGLTNGTGQSALVELAPDGLDIVTPSDVGQRRQALVKAFNNVEVFNRVREYYKGKHLPEDEFFGNTLVREFGITRERVEKFIAVYTASLRFVNSYLPPSELIALHDDMPPPEAAGATIIEAKPHGHAVAQLGEGTGGSRRYLDSCFVLMPFGEWFDIYYRDVYSQAIREAGFDPIRADDLFHSGSVMEQIWHEIRRAKVLVAEVTGRNANVFYELGLSHAAGRPVVILTASLEDVPFDLRHLRVVVYDIRDPDSASKVRTALASHLKNAKNDPGRSLPHPFRSSAAGGDQPADASITPQGMV